VRYATISAICQIGGQPGTHFSRSTIREVAFPLVSPQTAEKLEAIPVTSPRITASRLLALWHLASLDAPTVAVVWTLAIAWAAGVRLEPWIPLLIACGTWTAYAGDRLLDARRAIRSGNLDVLRERHYFHWRHRRKLLPIAACTAAIASILVLRLMPLAAREHDSLIVGAALAYFSGVHSPTRFPPWLRRITSKELLVGALFAAGCAAPAFSQVHSKLAGASNPGAILACVAFFAVLAWLNCTAIECWESRSERPHIRALATMTCLTGFAIALAMSFTHARASALVCSGAFSALLLLLLDRYRHRIAPLALRVLADVVLLVPAILILPGAYPG
jgi:hypothetical protein